MANKLQSKMSRRTALKIGVTSLAASVAGCSESGDESTGSEGTGGEATETGTDSDQTETVNGDSGTPENPGQPASHPPTPERLRTHLESVPQPQNALDAYDSDLEVHNMRTNGIRFGSLIVPRTNLSEEKYSIVEDSGWINTVLTASGYGEFEFPRDMVIDHLASGDNTRMNYLDATEEEIISQGDWPEPDETYEGWDIWGGGYEQECKALKDGKVITSHSTWYGVPSQERSHSGQRVKNRIDAHEGNEPSILEAPAGIGDQLSNVLNALEESGNAEHAGSIVIQPGSEEEPNNREKSYTYVDIINFFPDDTTNNYRVEVYPSGDAEWTEDKARRPVREGQDLS